ncbi:MAG: hypothetical protein ROD09_05360 [Candidatus Sedimenticola sp. (ex Thyasira tokunagai)]
MKHQAGRHLHMGCGEPLTGLAPLRTLIVKPQRLYQKAVEKRVSGIRRLKEKQR